jgi:hypothetical protein
MTKPLTFLLSLTFILLSISSFTHLSFAETMEEARKIVRQYNSQIKQDMSYSKDKLNPKRIKQEFIDYYKTDIVPRLETPVKFIRDEAIQWLDADWDRDLDIIFWTEGIWPAYGGIGVREFIYVVEMENGEPINLVKKKMRKVGQGDAGRYKRSMFFKYPNQNCGFNDFVRGMLTYTYHWGSGTSIHRYLINYNKYEQRIEIDEESSTVFLIPKGCN